MLITIKMKNEIKMLIKSISLRDTICLMISDDWQVRLVAEYLQARKRMLLIDLATEEYINDPRYEELVHQAYSMRPYIFQLEARINKYELNVIDIYNREHKANERKLEKLLRGIK